MEAYLTIIRSCIVIAFFASGLAKVRDPQRFIQGVRNYRILPPIVVPVFGMLLPIIELGLASGMLLGIAVRTIGVILLGLLTLFIVAISVNLSRGANIECSCFGLGSTEQIGPGSIVRNILYMVLITIILLPPAHVPASALEVPIWEALHLAGLASPTKLWLLPALVTFVLLTIHLLEWAIDLQYRIPELVDRPDGQPGWRM